MKKTKALSVKITIYAQKDGDALYLFASDGITDGPVLTGSLAIEAEQFISKILGSEMFFDPDQLPY